MKNYQKNLINQPIRLRHTLRMSFNWTFYQNIKYNLKYRFKADEGGMLVYTCKFLESQAQLVDENARDGLKDRNIIIDINNCIWVWEDGLNQSLTAVPYQVYGIYLTNFNGYLFNSIINNKNPLVDTRPFERSADQMWHSVYYTDDRALILPSGYTHQFMEDEKCCELPVKQCCNKDTCDKKSAALSLPLNEVLHKGTAERIVTVDTQHHNVDVYTGICDKRVVWVEDNASKLGVAAPFMKEDIIEFLR